MTIPTIVLENHRTGEQVVIEGPDLPEGPIQWGGQVRREVTRYAGTDNVSAQVLGTTDEDKNLSGVLDDMWNAKRGHALAMRLALEGLMYSGDLIRIGYNNDQRWGFLDVRFEEETPERIKYTLKFETLFRKAPTPVTLALAAAPVDSAARLTGAVDFFGAALEARPPVVRDDFALRLLLGWAAAQDALARVADTLSAVVFYAELTAEVARQVVRAAAGALKGLASLTTALKEATTDTLTAVTTPELLTAELWRDELLAEALRLSALTLSVARDMAAVSTPTSAREHTVKAGETLPGLALSYYGDFGLWPLIADGNGLDDDTITPGQVLLIPNRPSTK